jgi:chromate reductase
MPSKFDFHFVELHDLPMYNEDLWENVPDSVMRIKKDIEFADAVLFVTPEYNRSFSPVVKNVIDWGTRPYGQNSWTDKPAAIIGATPGAIGTAAAQAQLRAIIPVLGMPLMSQPEVHFQFKEEDFDADHNILNNKTREFLEKFLNSFDDWIKRTAKK